MPLQDPLIKRIEPLLEPAISSALVSFQRLLIGKRGLEILFGTHDGLIIATAAVAALVGMRRRGGGPGAIVLVILTIIIKWQDLPLILNHTVLEMILLLLLAASTHLSPGARLRLILALVLSVWFYAGIQKAAHGYYLTGEIFFFISPACVWPQTALWPCNPTPLLDPLSPSVAVSTNLILPFLGAIIIAFEVFLPLLALFAHRIAYLSLLILQFLVAAATNEWDFAWIGASSLILFFPRIAPHFHLIAAATLLYNRFA